MSDDASAAATAGGDGNVAPETTETKPVASALAVAAGDDDGGGDPPAGNPAATPENWRAILSGGDEALSKLVNRYTTPQNFAKAFAETRTKLRSGQHAQPLAEDATPEEIAAYRKAVGVPDAPEGYGFAFPQDSGATEADAAVLGEFSKFMHDRHVPPAAAKAAFDFYLSRMTEGRAAREEAAQEATLENMAQLRSAFPGRELQRNFRIADEFAQQHFTEHDELEAFNEVMQARLPNGVRIMDYAPFMKGLFKAARSQADEEALYGGDAGGGGRSIDEQIAEYRAKAVAGKITKAEDERYNQLLAARINRDERRGNRAA